MSVERWESNSTWLPFFAEAALTSFLSWCEDDVRTDKPVLKTMMRPVELFAPCPRIGLLDALEVLAWEKTTFPRGGVPLGQTFGVVSRRQLRQYADAIAASYFSMPNTSDVGGC